MAKRDHRAGKLPYQFVALPRPVLDSSEYMALPDGARSLLVDLLRQYTGGNNGRLSPSMIVMERYGWTSFAKLKRARDALVMHPFIVVTRPGRRGGAAEWIGVTWLDLNYHKSMDAGVLPWPKNNFSDLKYRALDPNQGRENAKRSPESGDLKKRPPKGKSPESGDLVFPETEANHPIQVIST